MRPLCACRVGRSLGPTPGGGTPNSPPPRHVQAPRWLLHIPIIFFTLSFYIAFDGLSLPTKVQLAPGEAVITRECRCICGVDSFVRCQCGAFLSAGTALQNVLDPFLKVQSLSLSSLTRCGRKKDGKLCSEVMTVFPGTAKVECDSVPPASRLRRTHRPRAQPHRRSHPPRGNFNHAFPQNQPPNTRYELVSVLFILCIVLH